MEIAYEALENAGLGLHSVAGSQTACFMGSSMSDYRDSVVGDFQHFPKYHILGVSDEMIANRISHFLDIHGPSATVQTACSSSLVATHLACQSLRSGESEMALAGGVGLIVGPHGTMHLNNLGFLNPMGHSRSFDQDAGGYGRGEGCGVLVLKRLDKALRDGDTIRAVIRGSGVNSDGWTQGVTMPSKEAQAALVRQVYTSNGLEYGATQYVEAHGTGTKAGDPIETRAIYDTIGQPSSSRKTLFLGSVKPNIGHLEAAAGVASIIKGVLALERGMIPPNINFTKANPAIPLDDWNVIVPTKLTPWPATKTRRMSVSGFGMGGTNAHVVMDAFDGNDHALQKLEFGASAHRAARKRLYVLTSHDKAGVKRVAQGLCQHLESLRAVASNGAYLANLAHTLAVARYGLTWRSCIIADSALELQERLSTLTGDDAARTSSKPPRVGLVFTGQGAQWARMGIEMLQRPIFRDSVEKSSKILQDLGCEWDPIEELSKEQKLSRLDLPKISQPICSVLQIALVDELKSWGLAPAKVVGHSSGEIAAAYTIGALSHHDALAAAFFRGVVSAGLRSKNRNGGMMAVGLSKGEAQMLMKEMKVQVTVACINSPSNVTLSGDALNLEALRATLNECGVFARRLKVDVAYHSPHMHLCSADYHAHIASMGSTGAQEVTEPLPIAVISSVTGHEVDAEYLGPYYWVQNLISPVQFTDAVQELVAPIDAGSGKEVDFLLEVGPHSALGGPVDQILSTIGVTDVEYASMLTRGKNALETMSSVAVDLINRGLPLNVSAINGDARCRLLTDLPAYAWNHSQQFRADSRVQRELVAQEHPTKALLGALLPKLDENERVWRGFLRLDDEPWLRSHRVGSTVLFPGAGMLSLVLEASHQIAEHDKTPHSFRFRDVSFLNAMALSEESPTEITVHLRAHLFAMCGSTQAAWMEFTVSSCVGPAGQLRTNCCGLTSVIYEENRSTLMEHEDGRITARNIENYQQTLVDCPMTCLKEDFYSRLAQSSLPYGNEFQGVQSCHPGYGETCYEVRIPDVGDTFTMGRSDRPLLAHATTLDCVLQGWAGSTCEHTLDDFGFGAGKPMVPASIGELEISAAMPTAAGSVIAGHCRSSKYGFNQSVADIHMFSQDLTRPLISVVDSKSSLLEMDDAGDMDAGDVNVDPSEITAEVRWDYALDLMTGAEINKAVLSENKMTSNERMSQLVRMVVHQRAAVKVVELVQSSDALSQAIMRTFPESILAKSQIHYGVLDHSNDNSAESTVHDADSHQVVQLNSSEEIPSAIATGNLFLVPPQASAVGKDYLRIVLERLTSTLAKGAMFLWATPTTEEDLIGVANGNFELVSSILANDERLALYRYCGSDGKQPNKVLTNGSQKEEISILVPHRPSSEVQATIKKLSAVLEGEGHLVTSCTEAGGGDAIEDKIWLSLLELEDPALQSLTTAAFKDLRELMVRATRLIWITRGENPFFGLVDGMVRSVNNEVATAKFQVLHLSADGLSHAPSLLSRLLRSPPTSTDNEFQERNGLLQVQRLYQSHSENSHVRDHIQDATRELSLSQDDSCYRLKIGKPGLLDSLYFDSVHNTSELPLGENELELLVEATGVNFRDIMASMGLVPTPGLGQEASGVVARAGSRAALSFSTGDRVSTLSVGGMHATKVRCDFRCTAKISGTMTFEEGAAAPMVLATAYHTLARIARLRRGQSVLIHSAAGGVGQAAIQLAAHIGLIIYVTVGSDEKRRFIGEHYSIADDCIFNSRDTSFVKGIQRMTDGRGVDCVLNSLSGELLRVSWGCLATFGTFVEIGLRDITDNARLDMRPFRKSATFSFFDVGMLIREDPEALSETLSESFKLLREGILSVPYPLTVYPVGQVEDAFRTMQQGRHRGKIVLSFSQESKLKAPVLCRAQDSLSLDPNATYLIIGGLGGLGRSLARTFVSSGARSIAFLSRSGDAKVEAKMTVQELTAVGAHVKVFAADVADEKAFNTAMEQCSRQLPPIKGVVQMAMVLRDVVFENMSYEEWSDVLRPKVQGTWNLHRYFDHSRKIDFMVFCSSISGITGNVGQAHYAAANTYQDALAKYRRSQDLKAVSVNLGIMRDVGVLAEWGEHNLKTWEPVLGIREAAFHALMKSIINSQQGRRSSSVPCPAQVGIGLGSADLLAAHQLPSPHWFHDPRFAPLAVATTSTSHGAIGDNSATGGSLSAKLIEAGTSQDYAAAAKIIAEALARKLADILRIPPEEVDPGRPMYSYGVDSLVALEVRNWITRELGANIALLDILAAVPMETFADQIARKSKLVVGSVA